jgi:putative oxidoreductase
MSRWLNRFQPWGVLFLRLVLGVALVCRGYSKVVPAGGFHSGHLSAALDHYAHSVAEMGLPMWLGYVSAFAEFVGGIFLIVGLLSRFFAFLGLADLLVAIVLVGWHSGYSATQYPLALGSMAFLILVAGPGKAALDRKIGFS